MRRIAILLLLALFACPASCWATFTEFYCNASTGSNTYAGSTEAAPVLTLTGGDWVSSTGVYTKTGAVTGVSTGMFAAVMVDGGTVAALVGRVTAVTANTVTISTTAKSGSLADQTATATINVGGPWKGPNGTSGFPMSLATPATLTDSSAHPVRINFKNNATYSITANVAGNVGPVVWQGYTSTVGDGGRFTLDGGTSGASYVLLTPTYYTSLRDAIVQNNGATGSAYGLSIPTGGACSLRNVTAQSTRGSGIHSAGASNLFAECEATACNQSNTLLNGGFYIAGTGSVIEWCNSHDNTGSNSVGYYAGSGGYFFHSVADTNAGDGFVINNSNAANFVESCDAYNNGGDGFEFNSAAFELVAIQNCNAVKNGAWGISNGNVGVKQGRIYNCGFGSGSQANTSGTIDTALTSTYGVEASGTITYASGVTPWVDPANGDFRVRLSAARGTGRGVFTGATGTVGYPDIGAAPAYPGTVPAGIIIAE